MDGVRRRSYRYVQRSAAYTRLKRCQRNQVVLFAPQHSPKAVYFLLASFAHSPVLKCLVPCMSLYSWHQSRDCVGFVTDRKLTSIPLARVAPLIGIPRAISQPLTVQIFSITITYQTWYRKKKKCHWKSMHSLVEKQWRIQSNIEKIE